MSYAAALSGSYSQGDARGPLTRNYPLSDAHANP